LFLLKVDSIDSQSRTILTIEEQGTYNTSSMTNYKKVENISERRDLVKKLNKEGKSQNEIASITMVSQKTICNDLKAINKNK
jgi:DNA-binding NarL/FixJ family response regulator